MRASILIALLALGAGVAPAAASTVARDGSAVVFTAAAREVNQVSITFDAGRRELLVSDAPMRDFAEEAEEAEDAGPPAFGAGPGCAMVSGTQAACPADGVTAVRVALGDADDRLTLASRAGDSFDDLSLPAPLQADLGDGDDHVIHDARVTSPLTLVGGLGDDRLAGGRRDDVLDGGPGDDSLSDGGGADRLTGGDGADSFIVGRDSTVDCGPGRDAVSVDFPRPALGDGCGPVFRGAPLRRGRGARLPFVRLHFGPILRATRAQFIIVVDDDRHGMRTFRASPRGSAHRYRLRNLARPVRRRCVEAFVQIDLTDADGDQTLTSAMVALRARRRAGGYTTTARLSPVASPVCPGGRGAPQIPGVPGS